MRIYDYLSFLNMARAKSNHPTSTVDGKKACGIIMSSFDSMMPLCIVATVC